MKKTKKPAGTARKKPARKKPARKKPRTTLSRKARCFFALPQAERDEEPDDPATMREIVEYLDEANRRLGMLYRIFSDTLFTEGERKSRATRLFPTAEDFVREVNRALRQQRKLFSDLPADPERAELYQEIAEAIDKVRGNLLTLTRFSADAFLDAQATAIELSMAPYQTVLRERDMPYTDRNRWDMRALAMAGAAEYAPKKGRIPKKDKGKRKRGKEAREESMKKLFKK